MGGVKLPLALAELGLIDVYEFVVHPRLAGHGSTLFAGLGVAPAVANAVYHPTGKRIRDLPITPEKIL